tara:strand:+ start:5411 stop:5974 length:564 start_codon:yes stop_codon:yes gene_type:complete
MDRLTNRNPKYLFLFFFTIFLNSTLIAEEMIIGKEKIYPGIALIFEGAIKDNIYPEEFYLSEQNSDIHIEALATWTNDGPVGSVEGGFVPYLEIKVKIINQKSQKSVSYDLVPHINLTDNFHYANNVKLPGKKDDLFEVIIDINPPSIGSLGYHYDWRENVNKNLISKKTFVYKDQNFSKWASLSRR